MVKPVYGKQVMIAWLAGQQKRTCAQPVVLGLCPKLKYPPFYGGIFIAVWGILNGGTVTRAHAKKYLTSILEYDTIKLQDQKCRLPTAFAPPKPSTESDEQAKKIIEKISKCRSISEFQALDKETRNKYLAKLREQGLSIRQISRLTGVNVSVVKRI